jgi:predicted nucleic acid-binding protein
MSLVVIADPKLYSEITITPEVAHEYGRQLPSWLQTRPASEASKRRPEISSLDPGEASSIALALDSEEPLLIIDEKKGRRVAEGLNIEIIGTVGILIRARVAHFIQNPETLLLCLESVSFRLDEDLRARLMSTSERDS